MKTLRPFTLILFLCLAASSAYAFEMPNFHFFEPTPDDLSRWYLGNIFGSDLVPGSNVPNMQLLGKLFGIFNQVALVVTIIIVTYTIGAGTLNTAAQGKALGEKWNAVWMPIRIVVGIAMLVPKPGAGYCLAQYCVMWIIMAGVGAADTLWGKMLDYFQAGGAVTVLSTEDKPLMFSYDNMNYTYALQTDQPIGGGGYGAAKTQAADMLKSLVCVEAFNNDPANKDAPPRKAYLASATFTEGMAAYPILMFGDPKQFNYNMPINDNQSGSECGYIKYKVNMNQSDKEIKKEPERATIYMSAMLVMANKLDDLAKVIVTTSQADDDDSFPRQYTAVQRAMQLYVNYITSYRNILAPVRDNPGNLNLYKQFGWILAGNYYSVLTNFREKAMLEEQQFVLPVYDFIYTGPISKDDPNGYYPRASSFYTSDYFTGSPDPMYAVPGSEYKQDLAADQPAAAGAISPVTRSKVDLLKQEISKSFNEKGLSGPTKKRVDEFMKYLTGKGNTGLSSQNPIMNAAKYGKELTEIAVTMMTVFGATWIISTWETAKFTGTLPWYWALLAVISDITTPLMLALCGFLYTMGATLGIFIPLIPYVTFLTGVVGFMLAVVESIAAAPLVCMGLIFPETKDEIWGRAAPAYMLMLNLFLRPSLMIIGFAAAMILMWIITEILNIGFIILLGVTFQIENMFGFVTILTVYVAAFTYIVTEVYSLINVVPNRVLAWIGDQSMGVKGAKEAIGVAKQGTEAGAGATVGGLEASQKADMWRAQEHLGDAARLEDAVNTRLKGTTDFYDPKARERTRREIMDEGGPGSGDDTPTAAKAAHGRPPGK